jgi:hypothetical protein
MKYLPLLNVYLTHTYYADRRCPDFRIEPTAETQKLLDNYRCVLKPLPNGIRVLAAVADDGAAFIPLLRNMTFAFQLWLQNPDFTLFTDLTEIAETAAPVYTNDQVSAGAAVRLKLVSRRAWATERFAVRQPSRNDAFTLSGRPLAGLQAADFKLAGLGPVSNPTHYDASAKIITIDSSAASIDADFEIMYPTAPRRANGVFADIEITYGDAVPSIARGPGVFQIDFAAKPARWKYYIVADSASATFRIEDKDKQAPLVFSAATNLKQPDPSDAVAVALAQQYPAMQRLRFVSEALVSCRQTARNSIQLLVDGNLAISALPNPALHNYTIDVKPGDLPGEHALFHVVTLFT